ncbi:MAG: protein kinase [Acetobacteraceae bacterium]|nr:protein kinase [Acetobacteraceae bacterium]
MLPGEPALSLKGVAVALADGISSSRVSAVASSVAVRSFLDDYYCTPETWSVPLSANRVVAAINAWLNAETRNGDGGEDRDRGYVCTFDAVIIRGRSAHLFHVGDGRIARVAGRTLERLTTDHRVAVSSAQSFLARALGADSRVEIDHLQLPIQPGDVFVLTTDGVHDHLSPEAIAGAIGPDLDAAAAAIVAAAETAGSRDNLTVQLIRVETLPPPDIGHLLDQAAELPPAPVLEPGQTLDGYKVVRSLHDSARSHLYLATAPDGGTVVLKVPSVALAGDQRYLRRFMMEEWIARRVDSPYVVKHLPPDAPRSRLYLVLEYVEGATLAQWMRDHASPSLDSVRGIVEQVARGLDAFHRREMVHGDLRPENIIIDRTGTARLIDFGSSVVPGVNDWEGEPGDAPLGTAQYSAPELLLGAPPSPASDVCSLGLIAYHMLTGRLPYGAAPARARNPAALRRLRYRPATEGRPTLPDWVDGALRKAVHPSPPRRYDAAADFVQDLRSPNPVLTARSVPLAERDPVVFWKTVALALAIVLAALLVRG